MLGAKDPPMSGPPELPRVVMADDHPFYRDGLSRLLRRNGIAVVAEAPNAGAAIRAVEQTAAEVVIMDLNMPGLPWLEATRRLGVEQPGTRVLVLTVSVQPRDVAAAILAGAGGYLLKDDPLDAIVAGVRSAAVGGFPLSPRVARYLLDLTRHSARPQLSREELDVLRLLAEGRLDREVAEILGIRPGAIRRCVLTSARELGADLAGVR
jgi:DNA-binding NarL/FixJ family response regulator